MVDFGVSESKILEHFRYKDGKSFADIRAAQWTAFKRDSQKDKQQEIQYLATELKDIFEKR
jgi:hypothetical protein